MSVPEFRSADQARFEDWEKVHNRRFTDVLRLFDTAVAQARDGSPESRGYRVEACIDGFVVRVELDPPVKAGSFGRVASASFSRDRVQAVVMENPDLLALKDENGRVTVSTKKYLDKEWEAINGKLRDAGMRYVRENRRWEQA